MKIIKRIFLIIILLILLVALTGISILLNKGYNIYKNAINEMSIKDKVAEIQSNESYTKLEDLPEFYKNAVIAVEDRRFYNHGAVDPIALARAVLVNIRYWELREGGSTITQQLAKNIYFTQEKSALRKIAEIFMAFELEKNLDKDIIFELYLNTSYFGDGYYCIKDASLGYYGKEPKDMNRNESSMLAGIPNAPSAYCPTDHLDLAQQRQKQVLDKMVKYEYITEEEKNEILQETNAVVEKVNQTEKISE